MMEWKVRRTGPGVSLQDVLNDLDKWNVLNIVPVKWEEHGDYDEDANVTTNKRQVTVWEIRAWRESDKTPSMVGTQVWYYPDPDKMTQYRGVIVGDRMADGSTAVYVMELDQTINVPLAGRIEPRGVEKEKPNGEGKKPGPVA